MPIKRRTEPREPIADEDMLVSSRDYFVTETKLNPQATVLEVAEFMSRSKTTGQVILTMSEGRTMVAMVSERTKIEEGDANEVRRVLGMDYEVEE